MDEEIDQFYDDPEIQVKYESRINELVKVFKKRMKKAYTSAFHFDPIKQIARCELAINKLEKIIANDKNLDDTPMKDKVKYEQHLRALWSQLQMDMKGQRGDSKNVNLNASDNFKDFLTQSILEMNNMDEDDENET